MKILTGNSNKQLSSKISKNLKNKLVMIEGSNANISPKLLIQRNQVAINIINMIASKSNSNLDSNEPNYVKSLTYRKINE